MPTDGRTAPVTPVSHTFMSSELEGLHFWISVTFSEKHTHFNTNWPGVRGKKGNSLERLSQGLFFLSSHHYLHHFLYVQCMHEGMLFTLASSVAVQNSSTFAFRRGWTTRHSSFQKHLHLQPLFLIHLTRNIVESTLYNIHSWLQTKSFTQVKTYDGFTGPTQQRFPNQLKLSKKTRKKPAALWLFFRLFSKPSYDDHIFFYEEVLRP